MFGKAVLASVLAFSSVGAGVANACSITSFRSTGSDVDRALDQHAWEINNYNAVCSKLNQANAALWINGMATVLDGKAIVWASASLRDKNLDVSTAASGGRAIIINPSPSMDVARRILPEVINDAVNSMDIDKAIASLNASRKKVRAAYQK